MSATPSRRTAILKVDVSAPQTDAIDQAARIIQAGGLVAFPTETVYGLGANALDAAAVDRIFAAKGRPSTDPIIVHLAAQETLPQIAHEIPERAWALAAAFWPGPLTLILQRAAPVPENVSAGRPTIAVRMPSHLVAQALITAAERPVAAPSANRFSRPSATSAQHVIDDLDGRIDLILDGGPTPIGVESTVVDLTTEPPRILRPGGISIEALRPYLPDVQWTPAYLTTDQIAVAPGQMIRHYAPRAELLLFSGSMAAVRAAILDEAGRRSRQGARVGVLTTDEEAPLFAQVIDDVIALGRADDLERIAAGLFAAIRDLDGRGVDAILAHGFGQHGLGAALWDRLLRAAEGRVIAAE
ncbi:MAG: L-threonylcarbamoyladenylate synthase [Aggregatilineales bacterium]